MRALWQDLRYGARVLASRPGITAITIVTLAIGIGANTAIFSVVHGVLLQPLPYEEPDRLVLVRADAEGLESIASISAPELRDLQERSRLFEEFGGVWSQQASIVDDEPEQIWHAWTTANLFSLLGKDPILGRHFLPEEEAENGPDVMILGYGIWQRRYGGDPKIVGKPI